MLPINGDESRSGQIYNFYISESLYIYIGDRVEVAQLLVYDTNGIIFTLLASLQKKKNSIIPIVHSCVLLVRASF